jgi:hypothetical protein
VVNNWTVPFAPVSAALTLDSVAPIQAAATKPSLGAEVLCCLCSPQVLDGLSVLWKIGRVASSALAVLKAASTASKLR